MLKENITLKKGTSKSIVKSPAGGKAGKRVFISDVKQTASLVKAGRDGAKQAIRAARALGLPITYLEKGTLYKESPDGTKEILKKAPVKKVISKKASQLKKGMILYAKG